MLKILNKEIDVENSPTLYDAPFTPEALEKYWEIYNGEWWLDGEWLTGRNPGDYAEFIISKEDYPGNILMDFEARTVEPCDNDINFLWNLSMDEEKNLGDSYIASIGGWWEGKVGLEKAPNYDLFAANSTFKLEPGRTYHIQGGSINGHCFLFIDGNLVIETVDFNPIDSSKHTKVGFDVYASHVQIRNVKVKSIKWKEVRMCYADRNITFK